MPCRDIYNLVCGISPLIWPFTAHIWDIYSHTYLLYILTMLCNTLLKVNRNHNNTDVSTNPIISQSDYWLDISRNEISMCNNLKLCYTFYLNVFLFFLLPFYWGIKMWLSGRGCNSCKNVLLWRYCLLMFRICAKLKCICYSPTPFLL